jgi:hypothetical protein
MMLEGILLERDSRLSLRRQLVGHLEGRILGGQIGPGRCLPSVRRAEEYLGLHRNTVAAAYRDLVRMGLVRTRPGSGVYVRRESRAGAAGLPCVNARGPRQLDLMCRDPWLGVVLKAELEKRLRARVWLSSDLDAPGTALQLAPPVCFVRIVRSLPKPSVVAVISGSEVVHRLASIAVLIHGGERIGYLPVRPANRRDVDRMHRVARVVFADYSELGGAGRWRRREVPPLPVISTLSYTSVTMLLDRFKAPVGLRARASNVAERSLRTGVQEP